MPDPVPPPVLTPGKVLEIGDVVRAGDSVVILKDDETRVIEYSGAGRIDSTVQQGNLDSYAHRFPGRSPLYWPRSAVRWPSPSAPTFLPYPVVPWPDGGIPASATPVNQLPYLFDARFGAYMGHACTFAHQIVDFNPTGYMLGDPENVDLAPLDPHTDASNKRTRVVLRYARALVGYIFRRFEKWEDLSFPPSTEAADGPQDWRVGLARIQELDAMICNICGGGGNWLREFQHHMSDPDVWTWAMREVHDADTTAPYVRLPKIDKTNPTSWVPSTENVTTPGGHVTALANQEFYKAMIGHFRRAFLRWDAEERVRA